MPPDALAAKLGQQADEVNLLDGTLSTEPGEPPTAYGEVVIYRLESSGRLTAGAA